MVYKEMNSNRGPSAMKWRTVRPEVPDCPRDGLSARTRRTNNVSVYFDFYYGLSNMDIRTVRDWAVAHRRARRWRLRPRFWVGFVSMGSWECIELIPSDRFDMHKVFWALGHQWWRNPKGSKDICGACLRAKGRAGLVRKARRWHVEHEQWAACWLRAELE
jgi:hypothetical protein